MSDSSRAPVARTPRDDASGTLAEQGWRRAVRVIDTTVTVVLFLVQIGLWPVALMMFIAFPMSIDNCAYVACGDEKWITCAMWTAAASAPVGVPFIGGGIILLAKRKIAFWAGLLGCFVQLMVLWAAWIMAGLAGPV